LQKLIDTTTKIVTQITAWAYKELNARRAFSACLVSKQICAAAVIQTGH